MSERFGFTWPPAIDLRSRGIRAALSASAALLLYALALAPAIESWRQGAERARTLRAEIAVERAMIAEGERIDQRVAAFEQALAERLSPLPAAAEGDSRAYADLQDRLGRMLRATGTQLRNVTWGRAERQWGIARLPMRIVVAGDAGPMAELVAAVSESPRMRFDDLSLQRDPIGEGLILIATLVGYQRD